MAGLRSLLLLMVLMGLEVSCDRETSEPARVIEPPPEGIKDVKPIEPVEPRDPKPAKSPAPNEPSYPEPSEARSLDGESAQLGQFLKRWHSSGTPRIRQKQPRLLPDAGKSDQVPRLGSDVARCGSLRFCYEGALQRDEKTSGVVEVKASVKEEGDVVRAELHSNSTEDEQLGRCVLKKFCSVLPTLRGRGGELIVGWEFTANPQKPVDATSWPPAESEQTPNSRP